MSKMGKSVETESRLVERVTEYGVSLCVLNRWVMSNSFVTPWPVAHQTPLSLGFPKQEYWSRSPFPPPGDLPNPRIQPASLESPALAGRFIPLSHLGSPAGFLFRVMKLCRN